MQSADSKNKIVTAVFEKHRHNLIVTAIKNRRQKKKKRGKNNGEREKNPKKREIWRLFAGLELCLHAKMRKKTT